MYNWENSFSGFSGRIVTSNSSDYQTFCKAFNGNFVKTPGCIVFPESNTDVSIVLSFANHNNVPVSIHNGGHSTIASGLNNGSIVINTRALSHINISDNQTTITVGSGVLAHEIDTATTKFGKAIPLGDCPVVGIAGLVLGGGIGFLSRSVGLTCDHLLEVEMVSMNGEVLTCNESNNEQLFTLMKGGGQGNFGVVTSLTFRLVNVPSIVYGGNLCWTLDQARDILIKYEHLLSSAPNELNLYCRINEEMGPMIKVYGMYNGDAERGEAFFNEMRTWGKPIFDNAKRYEYLDVQKINESTIVESPCFIWKNGIINGKIDKRLASTLLELYDQRPTPYCRINIDTLSGAVQNDKGFSAFPHRNSDYIISTMGVWFDEADKQSCLDWARTTHDELEPFFTGGVYVNYADPKAASNPVKYYGSSGNQILKIKKHYDPNGLLIGTLNPEPTEYS